MHHSIEQLELWDHKVKRALTREPQKDWVQRKVYINTFRESTKSVQHDQVYLNKPDRSFSFASFSQLTLTLFEDIFDLHLLHTNNL